MRLAHFCHEAGVTRDCHLNMCARLLGGVKDGVMRNPKTVRPRSNSGSKQRGAQERHATAGAAARERAPSFDLWASYAPAQPIADDDIAMPEASEPPSVPSRPAGPRRAAWHELSAVDGQFETELATLAFKDLKVDASGLVFARRDQLTEVEGISSKSPLALAIPGHSLKNLPESIVLIPNRITCTLVVIDPSLQRKELKNVMLIPLGAAPIKLKANSQEDFTPGSTAEVAVLACRSNYEADGVDWSGFVSNVRTQLRDAVLQQITSDHRARTEFYAWRKLSDEMHRVIVRVPSPAFEPLLAASGVSGPFTVQPVWRTADRKEELDKKFTIEWLGHLSLAESRVVLRKLPKHYGLQLNKSVLAFGLP